MLTSSTECAILSIVDKRKDSQKAERYKGMKETVKAMLFVGVAFFLMLVCVDKFNHNDNYYYRTATVTKVVNNVYYLTDNNGEVWTVENVNLKEFGRYSLLMNNQGTEEITDDTIECIE